MLPVSQIPFSQSSSQGSLYSSLQGLSYPDIAGGFGPHTFAPQSLHDASFLGVDLNSPDVFKQNIHLVLEQLARVQNLARNTITGIEQAYRPGMNPVQSTTEITALNQALQVLADILKQTGVGALPLLPPGTSEVPSEPQLMADTTKAIQAFYERFKRMQDNSSVVANLLTMADQATKR